MHLLQCLFFLEAHFGFDHLVSHIPGRENSAVDALSKDNVINFFSLLPQAPRMPSPMPQALCELLACPEFKGHVIKTGRMTCKIILYTESMGGLFVLGIILFLL